MPFQKNAMQKAEKLLLTISRLDFSHVQPRRFSRAQGLLAKIAPTLSQVSISAQLPHVLDTLHAKNMKVGVDSYTSTIHALKKWAWPKNSTFCALPTNVLLLHQPAATCEGWFFCAIFHTAYCI